MEIQAHAIIIMLVFSIVAGLGFVDERLKLTPLTVLLVGIFFVLIGAATVHLTSYNVIDVLAMREESIIYKASIFVYGGYGFLLTSIISAIVKMVRS